MKKSETSNISQVITLGCRLNAYESEIIREYLNQNKITNTIVINTCAVTAEAQRQAKQTVRKAKKDNPDAAIIVTGCAAQIDPKSFAAMPGVTMVLGNQEKLEKKSYLHLVKVIENGNAQDKILVNDIMSVKETASHLVTSFVGKTRAFVQIQNGCDHRCTFCIIPYGRGNNRSSTVSAIARQVKHLVEQGYQEVVFTGVDISDYGKDLPGSPTLAQMVRRVLALVPELSRLRLSSIDVAEIDQDLFNLMATEPRLMPHVHISLQAGDDIILKRMKRRHNRQQVIDFCHQLRAVRPEVAFGADIIAGFPTETDEKFDNTKRLIVEAGLQYLHVFPYSPHEGTPAAKMPQIDSSTIKERAKILREEGLKELTKFLNNNVGKYTRLILEKNNFGHTDNFIPASICSANAKMPGLLLVQLARVQNYQMIAEVV